MMFAITISNSKHHNKMFAITKICLFFVNWQIWCYLKPITLQTKDLFALMVINNWVIFVLLIKNNIKFYLFCIFFSDYSFVSTRCPFCCIFFTRFLRKSFVTIKNCLFLPSYKIESLFRINIFTTFDFWNQWHFMTFSSN